MSAKKKKKKKLSAAFLHSISCTRRWDREQKNSLQNQIVFRSLKCYKAKPKCPFKKRKKLYVRGCPTNDLQLPKPSKTCFFFILITFLFIKLSIFTLNKIIIFYNNRTFNSKIVFFCLR